MSKLTPLVAFMQLIALITAQPRFAGWGVVHTSYYICPRSLASLFDPAHLTARLLACSTVALQCLAGPLRAP
jgi:hypothetical protein